MPALTISTGPQPEQQPEQPAQQPAQQQQQQQQRRPSSRSSSPARPPVSPITPTQAPAATAPGQPPVLSLSHSAHPERVPTVPVPPPQPLDFDDNADVIALRSTISLLQMQSRRADSHIRTLRDVKGEALRRPEDFVQHLAARDARGSRQDEAPSSTTPEWPELPDRISVARCPPINWSQYAVVGDALDKIHDEQVRRPAQGAPAVYANGVYEFKGGQGKQDEYQGPTAPYDPLTENVGSKVKGRK